MRATLKTMKIMLPFMSDYSIKKTKVINWEVVSVSLRLLSKNHLGWFIKNKI